MESQQTGHGKPFVRGRECASFFYFKSDGETVGDEHG